MEKSLVLGSVSAGNTLVLHQAGVLDGKLYNNVLCIIMEIQILLLGGGSGCPSRNRIWNIEFEFKGKRVLNGIFTVS